MKKIPPKNPHFFKPILPGFKNCVKIPITFLAKYLKGQGPNFAILRSGDRSWRVKINGRMLSDGWENFAADNGLHVGDFVVFRHEGERVFDVSIFEPSHCEREYPLPHGGFSVPQPSNNFGDLNQKSVPVDEGSVPDLERAEQPVKVEHKTSFTSKDDHPFFVSTLHPYSLKSSRLYIPNEFARSNGLVGGGKREMILRDDKERWWSVVLGRTGNSFGLSRGWHEFQMANDLKEGDAYKFELIESGKKLIAKFHLVEQIAQGTASTMSSAENPHFVSTIKPYCLRKPHLYLPIEFARSNGLVGSGKREMILRDDKERSWPVVLGRMGYHVGLVKGWHDFQMANGLKEGDAYKFELIESGKKPVAKFHYLNQKSSPIDVGSVPELERAESKLPVSYPELKRAFTSKDDHPFFVSTLLHYSLKLSHLNIPSDFARENGLWNRQCKMILKDLKQRSWPVELDYKRNRASIKHGWDKFCGANGLVEGDTFVFKLIDNGETPIAKVYVQGTASTTSSSADHPHFVSTIKPYCISKPYLYLPTEFARSHGLVDGGKREMILRDDKERSWSVVLGKSGNHFGLLRGWPDFRMANGLKGGDSYKFELIESGKKPVAKFHCEYGFSFPLSQF